MHLDLTHSAKGKSSPGPDVLGQEYGKSCEDRPDPHQVSRAVMHTWSGKPGEAEASGRRSALRASGEGCSYSLVNSTLSSIAWRTESYSHHSCRTEKPMKR